MRRRLSPWFLAGTLGISCACALAGRLTPPERLAQAVYAKDFGRAEALIRAGADPNAPEFDGGSLLEQTALRGDPEVLRFLAAHGAKTLDKSFLYAMRRKKYENARCLLDLGAHVDAAELYGRDALYFAALDSDAEGVRRLQAWGAKPKLEHQLAFCPAAELSEAQRLFLGALSERCLCRIPATIASRCEEAVLRRSCVGPDGAPAGYATVSDAHCLGGRRIPYRAREAVFYRDGDSVERWALGKMGRLEGSP